MKIVIIGAGQGGLRAASLLAKGGVDVTVYEKNNRNTLAINWFDGVETKLFNDLNIPVPSDSFKAYPASFIGPHSEKRLYMWGDSEQADWSINRKTFSEQLIRDAEKNGAKFIFNTAVEKLIFNGNCVTGIYANEETVLADLVIDSSGVFSLFRTSLPDSAKITKMPKNGEIFSVFRGIYHQSNNAPELPLKDKFKIYLKYKGKQGISWCGEEPSGELNVLIGMIGKLSQEDFEELYGCLCSDNPIIGEVKENRCGRMVIPVRPPLPRFACPGYVAVGDAAFMTIPVMGNGIANSIRAGQILAEVILKKKAVDMTVLWDYQVRYYKTIGAPCFLLDKVKCGLLQTKNEQLKAFIESETITDEDVEAVFSGAGLHLSVSEWADKIHKLYESRAFIGGLLKAAQKGLRAMIQAYTIPVHYNPKRIDNWQKKTELLIDA